MSAVGNLLAIACQHAQRDTPRLCLTVRPSIRRSGIVSKRMNISSDYFNHLVGALFQFF